MTALRDIERPNRTQPLPPPPPTVSRRRWISGTIVVLGVGVAIWWGLAIYLGMLDRISAFERVPIPSSEVTVASEPGTKVLYLEGGRRVPGPAVRFTVLDPSGRAVAVQTYEGDLRYDVPKEPGRVGRAVAAFEADTEGAYSIDVIGPNTEGRIVAIGTDVARPSVPGILGTLFLLSISAAGGALLLGQRLSTRRGRS